MLLESHQHPQTTCLARRLQTNNKELSIFLTSQVPAESSKEALHLSTNTLSKNLTHSVIWATALRSNNICPIIISIITCIILSNRFQSKEKIHQRDTTKRTSLPLHKNQSHISGHNHQWTTRVKQEPHTYRKWIQLVQGATWPKIIINFKWITTSTSRRGITFNCICNNYRRNANCKRK